MRTLEQQPCQALCAWRPVDGRPSRPAGAPRLFRCRGCGSEWDTTQAWTPVDADGTVPDAVRAERP